MAEVRAVHDSLAAYLYTAMVKAGLVLAVDFALALFLLGTGQVLIGDFRK